ncbi:MAG: DUF7059 domain-containing protein [Propionibacteriaceae bacterium]
MTATPLLDHAAIDRLQVAFTDAGYHVDPVVERMGEAEHAALGRNQTTPGLRALAGDHDPLATLTRLWPLQAVVARTDAEVALPGLLPALAAAGIVHLHSDQVRAAVDIRPYGTDDAEPGYGGAWIVSDLSPGLDGRIERMQPEFVLGVSPASTSLAQLAFRTPVGSALDLGTGCGVQSLHLARHSQRVTGTDLNPRALAHADLTCRLGGAAVELRAGSLYEPVADERFDLIITNPPYVMSPPGSSRLAYREGSMSGDGLVEAVVTQGTRHLNPGGSLQMLGNWAHPVGSDWAERLAGWVASTGCDAHIVQREVLDPYAYIELWLADAGLIGDPSYPKAYADWMDYFDQLGVAAVGMGWITLHNSNREQPSVTIEDWPHPIEQPIGPAIQQRQQAVGIIAGMTDRELLAQRWVLAADVFSESTGTPGEADPHHVVLRQQRGFRRAVEVGTASGGVIGACDGELTLAQIVAGVAAVLGTEVEDVAVEAVPLVRRLILDGMVSLASVDDRP